MSSNVVDQPIAMRLKEAGWVKEVERHYLQFPDGEWKIWFAPPHEGRHLKWLPAPNVCEIGEDLSRINLRDYWWNVVKPEYRKGCSSASASLEVEVHYSSWLYSIMHNANELAEVWLWVTSNKKGE